MFGERHQLHKSINRRFELAEPIRLFSSARSTHKKLSAYTLLQPLATDTGALAQLMLMRRDIDGWRGRRRQRIGRLHPFDFCLGCSTEEALELATELRGALVADIERRSRSGHRVSQVVNAQRLFGDPDYLLHVITQDLPAFQTLYDESLSTLPSVQRLTSTLVMKRVVWDRPLPLENLP